MNNSLIHLASKKAQQAWIINATENYYLIPSQLLEDAHSFAETANRRPQYFQALPDEKKEALIEFSNVFKTIKLEALNSIPSEELIESNEEWVILREAALVYLAKVGFDILKWEKEEGLS